MIRITAALLTAGFLSVGAIQALAGQDAVTYQINTTHDGRIAFKKGFTPPLTTKWIKDLGGPVSYPVTANGLVFVTVGNPYGSPGTQLFALNLSTGDVVWQKAIAGTQYWSASAYDKGQLFVVNNDGLLQAFGADAVGALHWSVQMPNEYAFSSAPVAHHGQIFLCGAGSGGLLYAVDEATGSVKWMKDVRNGDYSSPAVGEGGVYVVFPGQYYRIDEETGAEDWHVSKEYSGGGGNTPVYHDHKLQFLKHVLDAGTGKELSQLPSDRQASFWQNQAGGNFEMALKRSTLRAIDLNTNNVVWQFKGDGALTTAPIVINDVVVIGSETGELYLLDAATGANMWSTNVGAPIFPSGEARGLKARPWTGIGAGENTLLVPASNLLAAYTQ